MHYASNTKHHWTQNIYLILYSDLRACSSLQKKKVKHSQVLWLPPREILEIIWKTLNCFKWFVWKRNSVYSSTIDGSYSLQQCGFRVLLELDIYSAAFLRSLKALLIIIRGNFHVWVWLRTWEIVLDFWLELYLKSCRYGQLFLWVLFRILLVMAGFGSSSPVDLLLFPYGLWVPISFHHLFSQFVCCWFQTFQKFLYL